MNNNSSKSVITQFIALMKLYDIRHAVVCPGSRNAPIVHTMTNQKWLTCHPVTDERSAAFVAIGLSDTLSAENGRNIPVAVCCTSGSAVLNMAPAVAEARYRNVPLLIVSADRPEAWIGQMDGQTLPQPKCFGNMAPSYSLREGDDDETLWYRNRIINEALSQLTANGGQPIHVNIHLSEPLFSFTEGELPEQRKITWIQSSYSPCDTYDNAIHNGEKIVVIVGQKTVVTEEFKSTIETLANKKNIVVIAENLSNITSINNVICNIDSILSENTIDALIPDAVIYIGGHIVSKRLKQYIRKVLPKVCIRFTDAQHLEDTFMCMTHQYPTSAFIPFCNELPYGDKNFFTQWHTTAKRNTAEKRVPELFTAQRIVDDIVKHMPKDCYISLANSSSVRLAQGIALENTIFCNRGVNGIDGSLSSAVGQAMATDKIVLLIIGDLSFLYDMNALWNTQLPTNLRILLLNNGGGEIFKTLPGLEKSAYRDKYIMAQHTTTVEGWASDARCHYKRITQEKEITDTTNYLFAPLNRCTIIEAVFENR